ncbi:putative deoxyribonuclease TATDN2 [Ranitomeya imitator]|uniref:putative deoxyribonuclease TATDN2 n=1 Tax=Ranitomeya imitator TaxID=111125 RepID=UPI0037E7223D
MTDRSASGSRKHRWQSPPEVSPCKYRKSSKSRIVSHSRERNAESRSRESDDGSRSRERDDGSRSRERDVESRSRERDVESRSQSREQRVIFSPLQSTPRRRPDVGTGVRSTVRAQRRQTDGVQSQRTATHIETSEAAPEKERDHQEQRNIDSNRRSSNEEMRQQSLKIKVPSLLFKRAFNDILGTPRRARDGETRSSHDRKPVEKSIRSDPEDSPPLRSTPKSTLSKKEAVGDRKQSSDDRKRAPSPRHTVINVTPSPEAKVPQEIPRLVFLHEDSDNDVAEKDPSIGSDFSDVEDVGPLARFSQDDDFPPCCSINDDTLQFESLWERYTEPITPVYRPPAERGTWRQKEQDSSYASEPSLLDSSRLSMSSDNVSPIVRSHKRYESSDDAWTPGRTTKSGRRTLEIPSTSSDSKFLPGGFIDTHCHLDMLYSRLAHRSSFADLREQFTSTFPREFQGCITDYCDPRTLHRLPWDQVLNEDLVWGAFGCHPHFAQYYDKYLHEEMMMALRHPKAIAFGEMGLDYSHKCSTEIADQIMVFEKQLKLVVQLGKPLVIHCRGADKDLFKILKKLIPRDYKIHRHCFTGSYQDIEPFLEEFPNMMVGFTAVLTYPSAVAPRDAVTKIPLDRLIVETDAPYFVPKQVPKHVCKFSHPGLAIHTVHEIARLQNLPIKSVMAKLRENTYRIYSV